jgi:hypothetical protein
LEEIVRQILHLSILSYEAIHQDLSFIPFDIRQEMIYIWFKEYDILLFLQNKTTKKYSKKKKKNLLFN